MNRKNIKKGACALVISLASLLVGFALISLPFHLFDTLSNTQMRIIFAAELAIYLGIFCIFFLAKEKKQQKAKAEKERRRRRKIKEAEINQAISDTLFSLIQSDIAA